MSRNIRTVRQLCQDLRGTLESRFDSVWVEGEVSALATPPSGHMYFSLKEENALIKCTYFRNRQNARNATPEEGRLMLVEGQLSLYQVRGELQLVVRRVEESGEGALKLAFERLKRKLLAEGLFESVHKKPLPAFPKTIGLITSTGGAVLHDILVTLSRRYPSARVIVYPAMVQGDQAPGDLASMIDLAGERNETDVIILARGGGSAEDLMAFNDEQVARAIFRCPVPLVSAIGHETDTSISDYVADERAPTPTAAAEMITPDSSVLRQRFEVQQKRIQDLQARSFQDNSRTVDHLSARLLHPHRKLQMMKQTHAYLEDRLSGQTKRAVQIGRTRVDNLVVSLFARSPTNLLKSTEIRHMECHAALKQVIRTVMTSRSRQLETKSQAVRLMGPGQTLLRGYAIVQNADKKVITTPDAVASGDRLEISVSGGKFKADVT